MTTPNKKDNHHFRLIPLAQLAVSSTNPRKDFDEVSLAQLAESIRAHGVLQPILVRRNESGKNRGKEYEIICGERRFRAAKLARLQEIPARLVGLSDEQALSVQIVENLQRADVHPLDEAAGFKALMEAAKLEITDIAQRVAKDIRFVTRRLALNNLIIEAQDDLRRERITLAHALEICRLTPEIQTEALVACFESHSVFDKDEGRWVRQPDKQRPARHVRYLQEWVEQNVHLNLNKAAFKKDDARLREDGLTCMACPQRSGFNESLFHDIKNSDVCLNKICFQSKLETFVQIKRSEIEAKQGKPPAYISTHYGMNDEEKNIIAVNDYQLIEKRGVRCEHAEQAIFADGEEVGRVKWICRVKSCKDHLGRVNSYSQPISTGKGGGIADAKSLESRNKRRQEIFEIKVNEGVRKRVMREALKTYSWPLERIHLNEIAKEFFRRIPSDDQQTITEVFGIEIEIDSGFRRDETVMLAELEKLDESRLAQFMMLCSFAHYGSNQYKNRQVDQSRVIELGESRGVNHILIDAETRAALAPKKYRAEHQRYVETVKNGKEASKPVVYERPQRREEETQIDRIAKAA